MHMFCLTALLPAHLNAFRGNVLDIGSCFLISPFSTPIRFIRAVSPCLPLIAPPVSPFRLFPSFLPSDRPVAIILAPFVVS